MSKESLITYLNTNRQDGTFTFFAVMLWAKDYELEQCKAAFNVLVDEGAIVPVEERMLGTMYRFAGVQNEAATH